MNFQLTLNLPTKAASDRHTDLEPTMASCTTTDGRQLLCHSSCLTSTTKDKPQYLSETEKLAKKVKHNNGKNAEPTAIITGGRFAYKL